LIGYVIFGCLVTIVQDVKTRVDKEQALKDMVVAFSIRAFKEHYISVHSREKKLPPFCVHHLFFYFAEPSSATVFNNQ
jgi:hypothetical protein